MSLFADLESLAVLLSQSFPAVERSALIAALNHAVSTPAVQDALIDAATAILHAAKIPDPKMAGAASPPSGAYLAALRSNIRDLNRHVVRTGAHVSIPAPLWAALQTVASSTRGER